MRDIRAVPADRLEVMYHAIPASQLDVARQIDRATARRELGFGDEFLFAAITKLGPDRGNETLLEAFAKIRSRVPNAKLAIVYKPTLYHRVPKEYEKIDWARDPKQMVGRITAVIERLGLGDSVRLVDSLDRPETFYAACDVVVAPFESVRFSSVNLVEAMAYGRPNIVTDIGEPAELADRYQSGIKVPVGDAAKMADAMVALATDPAKVKLLGQRAREGAADLTVDAVARRLSGVYEGLVSTASPKRAAGAEARS
jgi:glycosyltransferase involved in cell wall biosynthesis